MNYYGAKELAASFRTVRKNTITIAEEIDEKHYVFRATPQTRSIAETLLHITLAPGIQEHVQGKKLATLEGFNFAELFLPMLETEKKPHTKAQILEGLKDRGERFARFLEGLTDEFLGERVTMPAGMTPASKTRFEMLLGVKEHEMHHRGQLMLLERMVGVVPHLTRQMEARMAEMMKQKAGA
jgi:uncharacterized damage-inducible protein DinB